ncbi:MAG: hypothetical protein R2713_22335 [Ilumatobacteraceae bacterium]
MTGGSRLMIRSPACAGGRGGRRRHVALFGDDLTGFGMRDRFGVDELDRRLHAWASLKVVADRAAQLGERSLVADIVLTGSAKGTW